MNAAAIQGVIPAKAGIQTASKNTWIPAFAGMTGFGYVQ